MCSVLSALTRPFRKGQSHSAALLSEPFHLDPEALKSRYKLKNLEQQGRQHGAHNRPTSDTDHHDDIEKTIIQAVQSEAHRATGVFEAHQKTYTERLHSALGQLNNTDRLKSPVDQALSKFNSSLNHDLNKIVQLQKEVREDEAEVETFKAEHGLDRPAHYPESRMLHWGVILIILVVEAILNGSFLARGNELGLVGGTFEAVVIALINVAFGLCVGWKVVPECNHRGLYRRIFGAFGLFVYVVGVFGFNLAVAHYRTALGSDAPENAERLAFEALTAAPFLVEDMQSWLLFLLGCVFSGIAAIDGWRMDDPYPGYGAVTRLRDKAREDFAEQQDALFDELDHIRDEAVGDIEDAAKDMRNSHAEYHDVVQSRRHTEKAFHSNLQHIEEEANHLLQSYRDANIRARNTEPPRHFSEKWTLKRPDYQFSPEDKGATRDLNARIIETVNSDLANNRQRLIAAYDEAVATCHQNLA